MNQLTPIPIPDPLLMCWHDLNDLGNAERLVKVAGGKLLWVEGMGWAAYDDRRWSVKDGERRANQIAHDVARHVDAEAAALFAISADAAEIKKAFPWFDAIPDKELVEMIGDRVSALRKHAKASGDASRTKAMLTQAKTLIASSRDEFDQDLYAFNCENGTLRFYEGPDGWYAQLDGHDPEDKLMQISAFKYDEKAACPHWMERLTLVQPDDGQRELLRQLYGYMLTGLTSEQKFFIFQGRGGDGKSATNMLVAELFADYARHADVKTFLKGATKSGSDHSSDLARLAGDVRFVLCEEPDKNQTWDSGTLKKVTGGKVTARPLREAEIEFYPRWKLLVEVNPLPAVPSDDDGFWRRCWVVPWSFQFNKGVVAAEAMDLVVARLRAEAPGILNWMIGGTLSWLRTRKLPLSEPATVAMDNYRLSAGTFGEWLSDRCDLSNREAETRSGILYSDFKEWCERAGVEKIPTQTSFGRSLRDRQIYEKKDGRGNRNRVGIMLRADEGGGAADAPQPGAPAPAVPAGPAYSPFGVGGRASAAEPRRDFDEDGPPFEAPY